MFKKKTPKQHTVLNLNQEGQPQLSQHLIQANHSHPQHSSTYLEKDVKEDKCENQKMEKPKQPESIMTKGNREGTQDVSNKHKRQRNDHGEEDHDQDDFDGSKPSKKIKEEIPTIKHKNLFSLSTDDRKQRNQEDVHRAFNDLNYSAGNHKSHLQPDQLEEELAKERFLHNVELTKQFKEGKLEPNVYRGINSYANHSMTKDQIERAAENFKKKSGPSRLNSTIKNSCRFDYVLNLCKDWHDSGYCPFGDSCLYLHDRSVIKSGWELEKDFQKAEKERWKRINNPQLALKEAKDQSLKKIQKFKPVEVCQFCQSKFSKPVEVECGHIYCTKCAILMNKCKLCHKKLGGIMNNAEKKLVKQAEQYLQAKLRLEKETQDSLVKRRKFQNIESMDVFNE